MKEGIINWGEIPYISRFKGKIVIFNDSIPLTKKLIDNDIVFCEKILEKDSLIAVNPKKKLKKEEILHYSNQGIRFGPTKDVVFECLED